MLLVSRAYTSDAHQQKGGNLAICHIPILVYHPLLDTTMQIAYDASLRAWVYGILLKELHQYGDINHRLEYLVEPL